MKPPFRSTPASVSFLLALPALCSLGNLKAADLDSSSLPTGQVTVKDLGMERSDIARPDNTQWIFNGAGRTFPRRWSLTGFDGLGFLHWSDGYRFHFDFVEKRSGVRIVDNVYERMAQEDPLGWNFRRNAPFCIVPQADTWYPHFERKTGSFYKNFQTGTVSFGIGTRTIVPSRLKEVLEEITIENRDDSPLTLTLLPMQNGTNTLQLANKEAANCLVTDLQNIVGQGLEWTIPPQAKQTRNFSITQFGNQEKRPEIFEPGLAARVHQADQDGEAGIGRIAGRLPVLQTTNRLLADLYKRSLVSLAFCRFDYPAARVHPTWLCGGFPLIVAWDFSYAGDALSLIEPRSVRQVVGDVLGIGQLQGSYINPDSPRSEYGILYVQDPFALQALIRSYIKITGDRSICDDVVGGKPVYDWLKLWAAKLDSYATNRPDGLMDVGDGNELLLELRTDGYDHVVPTLNGLASEYNRWLAQLAKERKDPDGERFAKRAETLTRSLQTLWNERAGWFDNLYVDGSRRPFFTMHLFDLLGASCVTRHQQQAIASHFVAGEFLAPMGIYSISKRDTVHWDRFDQDWGGGGCYLGTPFRAARLLYEIGDAPHAGEILKRTAQQAEHFSYLPQGPAVDEAYENPRAGTLDISSGGAAVETIWSGIFGLRPQADGVMVVTPAPFDAETGEATLSGFQFRRHRYDVELKSSKWRVFVDGKLASVKPYSGSLTIPKLK
jgi:hypothetical protein